MWLLLLLPSLALASINLSLDGVIFFDNGNYSCIGSFKQKGFEQQVVTDEDLRALNINKELLKNIIGTIHGKRPDDVIVRSDSNWGVIYKRQNWNEVKRRLEPDVDDHYFDFIKEDVVLSETKYDNPDNKRKVVQITESPIINDYVMSIWSLPKYRGNNVDVKFDFDVDNEYRVEFERAFAIGDDRRYIIHRQFAENRTIELKPKQSVTARIKATKGTISIVVPYKLTLSGDVVAKYATMYKDQYFFRFDINQLIKKPVTVYQTFLYEFHYDMQLHIVGADDLVIRTFATERAGEQNSGRRKAAAEKKFESAGGVKLRRKAIPGEFFDLVKNAIVEDTVVEDEEHDQSGETA